MMVQLQAVYDNNYNPYEGGAQVAMVLRYEDKVYSNQPKEWFKDNECKYITDDYGYRYKSERYTIVDIDSMSHDSKQAEMLKQSLFLDYEFPLTRAIYLRVQRYGGAEEGGWWYHQLKPTIWSMMADLDYNGSAETKAIGERIEESLGELDGCGEGYLEYHELVSNEFWDERKQTYS